MSSRKNYDEIREFWTEAAAVDQDQDGLRPVARDPYLQQAVEEAMEAVVPEGSKVLDIGCGDGHTTLRFSKRALSITGIDYIHQFVDKATAAATRLGVANARFFQADVLDLESLKDVIGTVDVAVSIRCLINLDSWSKQQQAIRQIAKMLRPGGLCLLSEGWSEGLAGLNKLRAARGLAPINPVAYNLLMERALFENEITQYFKIDSYLNLGFYTMMSRFVQPCVVHPKTPEHSHPINALAAALQRHCRESQLFREIDYAGVYVLRRLG